MAVFDLEAVIKLTDNGFKQGLNAAGKAVKTFGKVAGAALLAGGAAVASLTTASVKAYADFEQLAGGAQLLFGDAFTTVAQNAQEAYKTVQMSQNEYLQQVNGFATGLKKSLDGNEQAAAELSHRIITAEADVVAATGNTQEAVQNAFNGIMRGNFTMLDNLQLGITPTKEGFQEVIDKVNEWNTANGKATDYQMGNLADMQSALVDYVSMVGLAGYAHDEAMGTITGSISATKAAWQNLLVAFGDKDADLGQYFSALSESAENAFLNILPVAEQALLGIGDVVANLAPVIGEKFPALIAELLPDLLSAAASLVGSLVEAIPGLLDGLWASIVQVATEVGGEQFGGALETLGETVRGVIDGISAALPEIDFQAVFDGAADVINGVADAISFCVEHFSEIETVAVAAGVALSGLWLIFNAGTIVSTVTGFIQKASVAFKAFNAVLAANPIALIITLIASLVAAFITAYNTNDKFRAKVDAAWQAIKSTAIAVFSAVRDFVVGAWTGIVNGVTSAVNTIKSKVSAGFNAVKGVVSSVWNGIKSTISSIMDGIKEKIQSAIDTVKSIVNFSWSLPKLKLPHFSISGSFSLNPPSVPKLSIAWYKRALNEPFMFSNATLFGAGEAGDEVLYGRSNLMNDIREASSARNDALLAKMDAILAVVAQYLPEAARKELYLDGDLLVGGTRAKMDNQLGELDGYGRRGVSIA